MNLKEAVELIPLGPKTSSELWLDLGCGNGLFTLALASQLAPASTIIAVDKDKNALSRIPVTYNGVRIETRVADFITDDLEEKEVDGILMANSLHFVKNKEKFLEKVLQILKTDAPFLLVEYDRDSANAWVPHPLMQGAAIELFKLFGYHDFRVIGKRSSVYGNHTMYAARIS